MCVRGCVGVWVCGSFTPALLLDRGLLVNEKTKPGSVSVSESGLVLRRGRASVWACAYVGVWGIRDTGALGTQNMRLWWGLCPIVI